MVLESAQYAAETLRHFEPGNSDPMVFELVHAHAESGILKGTKGFCPVAVTEGLMSKRVKPLHELARNQVVHAAEAIKSGSKGDFYSYFPIKLDGKKFDLLTRGECVTDADQKRAKFVVHQILVDHDNNPWDCGPASVLAREDLWVTRWSTKPQLLKLRKLDMPPLSPRVCNTWEKMTRDSGWAGLPVEAFEKRNSLFLLVDETIEAKSILTLFVESTSLLKKEFRWDIPFTIRAWHPFGQSRAFWQATNAGSQLDIDSMHRENVIRVDLTHDLARATGKFANDARNGNWVSIDLRKKSTLDLSDPESEIKLAPVDDLVTGSFVMSGSSTQLASVSAIRNQQTIDKAMAQNASSPPPTTIRPATDSPEDGDFVKKTAGESTSGQKVAASSRRSNDKTPASPSRDLVDQENTTPKSTQTKPDSVPDTPAAPNNHSWLNRHKPQIIRWGIVAVALLSCGIVAWIGVGYVQSMLAMVDDTVNQEVSILYNSGDQQDDSPSDDSAEEIENRPHDNPESEADSKLQSATESITQPAPAPTASVEQIVRLMEASDYQFGDLTLPKPNVPDSFALFSLPSPRNGLAEWISIAILTQDGKFAFEPSENGDTLTLVRQINKKPIALATISLTESVSGGSLPTSGDSQQAAKEPEVVNENPTDSDSDPATGEEYTTTFIWNWAKQAREHQAVVDSLRAGQFQFSLLGSNIRFKSQITAAQDSPKIKIGRSSFDRTNILPHLSRQFGSRQGFRNYQWAITNAQMVPLPESSQDEIWTAKVEVEFNKVFIELDKEYVRREAEAILGDSLSSGDLADEFTKNYGYYGPLTISSNATISEGVADDEYIDLTLRSQFGFGDLPSDEVGEIYFDRIPRFAKLTSVDQKTSALPEYLANMLVRKSALRGRQIYRIITSGGKGADKAPTHAQKCRLAIAGIYYKAAVAALDREIYIEVTRTGGPRAERFKAIAVQIPDEAETPSTTTNNE